MLSRRRPIGTSGNRQPLALSFWLSAFAAASFDCHLGTAAPRDHASNIKRTPPAGGAPQLGTEYWLLDTTLAISDPTHFSVSAGSASRLASSLLPVYQLCARRRSRVPKACARKGYGWRCRPGAATSPPARFPRTVLWPASRRGSRPSSGHRSQPWPNDPSAQLLLRCPRPLWYFYSPATRRAFYPR